MKALVVRQPWASLIADGPKRVETRSRRTSYRGPLLLVAGCSTAELNLPGPLWDQQHLPRGVALAVIELLDCRRMTPADAEAACCAFRPDLWAWLLGEPRRVERLPVRGMPGLFTPPPGPWEGRPAQPPLPTGETGFTAEDAEDAEKKGERT